MPSASGCRTQLVCPDGTSRASLAKNSGWASSLLPPGAESEIRRYHEIAPHPALTSATSVGCARACERDLPHSAPDSLLPESKSRNQHEKSLLCLRDRQSLCSKRESAPPDAAPLPPSRDRRSGSKLQIGS